MTGVTCELATINGELGALFKLGDRVAGRLTYDLAERLVPLAAARPRRARAAGQAVPGLA
ncbi:hypothetical protein [Streptomyces sp. NPDC048436]|uniref:hypothetical protein n=1 Tax=Streptomyces sp. NPDC048436 TaxID=3365550 RepID=UPI00371A7C54